jgi:mono/diheme cytochrome c family protein
MARTLVVGAVSFGMLAAALVVVRQVRSEPPGSAGRPTSNSTGDVNAFDPPRDAALVMPPHGNGSFLNMKTLASIKAAERYYDAVDPKNLRTNFGGWLDTNGFDRGTGDAKPEFAALELCAAFLNDNDLGFGRDMRVLKKPDGSVASYVTNFVDNGRNGPVLRNPEYADAALKVQARRDRKDHAGAKITVCMEYSPIEDDPEKIPIVKFFAYESTAPNGERKTTVDLDGYGDKTLPSVCLHCHGGDYENFSGDLDRKPTLKDLREMGPAFREFDVATFKFPGGAGRRPTDDELKRFRDMNLVVRYTITDAMDRNERAANGAMTAPAIAALITAWYPERAKVEPVEDWVPEGWQGRGRADAEAKDIRDLYLKVVAKSCRSCHIALEPADSPVGMNEPDKLSFMTFEQFQTRRHDILTSVCGTKKRMPHARVTYENFWTAAPSRIDVLLDFKAQGWAALRQFHK